MNALEAAERRFVPGALVDIRPSALVFREPLRALLSSAHFQPELRVVRVFSQSDGAPGVVVCGTDACGGFATAAVKATDLMVSS